MKPNYDSAAASGRWAPIRRRLRRPVTPFRRLRPATRRPQSAAVSPPHRRLGGSGGARGCVLIHDDGGCRRICFPAEAPPPPPRVEQYHVLSPRLAQVTGSIWSGFASLADSSTPAAGARPGGWPSAFACGPRRAQRVARHLPPQSTRGAVDGRSSSGGDAARPASPRSRARDGARARSAAGAAGDAGRRPGSPPPRRSPVPPRPATKTLPTRLAGHQKPPRALSCRRHARLDVLLTHSAPAAACRSLSAWSGRGDVRAPSQSPCFGRPTRLVRFAAFVAYATAPTGRSSRVLLPRDRARFGSTDHGRPGVAGAGRGSARRGRCRGAASPAAAPRETQPAPAYTAIRPELTDPKVVTLAPVHREPPTR
jgi:hypothetical protein